MQQVQLSEPVQRSLDATGHPMRRVLMRHVRAEPGANVTKLSQALGTPRSTVRHHLKALHRHGHITIITVGRERLVFSKAPGNGHDESGALAVLFNARTRKIAEVVQQRPGIIQSDLLQATKTPRSTFRVHMKRLLDDGLVRESRKGRTRSYQPTRNLGQLLHQAQYGHGKT